MTSDVGFSSCAITPCMLYHVGKNLRVVIHGDDFTVLGTHEDLMWFRQRIRERFEVKLRGMLGPGSKDDKSITLLNRRITWTKDVIMYSADPRHVEIVIKDLGLEMLNRCQTLIKRYKTRRRSLNHLIKTRALDIDHVLLGSITWLKIVQTFNFQSRSYANSCHHLLRKIGLPSSGQPDISRDIER